MGETTGFVKFVADAKTDELLGAHMIGPNVSELIAEVVLAFEYRASADDIGMTVHAHPTLSEATKEAALAALGPGAPHLSVTGYFALEPRPLLPEDQQGTRVLLMGALGVTPYIDRALEVLAARRAWQRSRASRAGHRARRNGGRTRVVRDDRRLERRPRVCTPPCSRRASTRTTWAARLMRCRRRRGARRRARVFCSSRCRTIQRSARCYGLLREQGFQEEARVPDFYRDGVALTFLRRAL